MNLFQSIFLLLFSSALILQFNDPDPYVWIAFYGLSCLTPLAVLMEKTKLISKALQVNFSIVAVMLCYVLIQQFLSSHPGPVNEFFYELGGIGIVLGNLIVVYRHETIRVPRPIS